MTQALREQEVQDAIYGSVVAGDWTDGHALRQNAERRLGCKIRLHEFSRAALALVNAELNVQRRGRGSSGEAPRMQYRRPNSSK